MKKLTISIFALLAGLMAAAQTFTLEDLEIPNSPAFILLDEAPTAIERPTTSKAFALSILNTLNNTSRLPKNYAAEFTPFWFFKHRNMTALKYMGLSDADESQNVFNNIKKASISIALMDKVVNDGEVPLTNLSIGIRANIISVMAKVDKTRLRTSYDATVARLNQAKSTAGLLPLVPDASGKVDKQADENYRKKAQNILDSIPSDVPGELDVRPIFALDFAAGYNEFYLNNTFSDNHFGRFGAWLTLNYSHRFDDSGDCYLNIYAAAKYLRDGTQIVDGAYAKRDFFDAGGKVELECKRLCVSYEWLRRLNKTENTTRSNGAVKYKISDKLYLTGAFGKNFGPTNNLISLLGINWGFSTGEEKVKVE